MMNSPPIEARCLDKTFGHSPVLRGVNLKVERGRGAIVVGRNGSGKSTLVRLLGGLSTVSAGQALLFGKPSRRLEPRDRRRVGLVTHQSFLYPAMTARENLEFYAALYGLRPSARDVARWLERVGLSHVADERLRTFSRGMEQRLTLARAIIAEPEVLLMDEPLTALDSDGVAIAIGLIEEAVARGCATVITAHEAPSVGRINFPCYELVRGRLRSDIQDSMAAVPSERFTAAI
jgi:heme exporter protein A